MFIFDRKLLFLIFGAKFLIWNRMEFEHLLIHVGNQLNEDFSGFIYTFLLPIWLNCFINYYDSGWIHLVAFELCIWYTLDATYNDLLILIPITLQDWPELQNNKKCAQILHPITSISILPSSSLHDWMFSSIYTHKKDAV